MTGAEVALPDPRSILPYLGLFTIVTLKPNDLVRCSITTQHQPGLSQLQDNRFSPAPHGTTLAAQNAARIFDVLAIAAGDPPITHGDIPLSSAHPEFRQQRYWRLPVKIEAVLAVLIERTRVGDYESWEIQTAQTIADIIRARTRGLRVSKPSGDSGPGSAPSGSGGGGPPSGGGVGGNGGGGFPSGGGGGDGPGGNEGPKGSGAHGGNSSMQKRTLRSSNRAEPPKRSRTNVGLCEGLGEQDVSNSPSGGPRESELSNRSGE
jgi:hypothetical protein